MIDPVEKFFEIKVNHNAVGHPAVQQALRNHYFDSLGLPRLHVSVPA
jgi:hypothetical protein